MRPRPAGLLAVAALVAAAVVARLSAGTAPSTHPAQGSGLRAVACSTPSSCLFVGSMGSVYGAQVPLALTSTGDSLAPSPPSSAPGAGDTFFTSVACTGPSSCIAVGRQTVPTAYFGARSAGVRPLAESWDGRTWHAQSVPFPPGSSNAGLDGIACTRSACMAVGAYENRRGRERALAETWDGRTWRLALPPHLRGAEDTVLVDVACTSPDACVAVGHFGYEVAELASAAAPLVEVWDGASWHPQPASNPLHSSDTELTAVACPPGGACVAVGSLRHPGATYSTLAEIQGRSRWTVLPTRDPAASPDTELADVACPRPDRCTAVGSTVASSTIVPFAESWDGARWTIDPTPVPTGARSSALTAVACPAITLCRAAGAYRLGSPIGFAFSAAWDGDRWRLVTVPGPAVGAAR